MSTISQLRRVSSSLESTQKLAKPRYISGTHHGIYCNYETPEGERCGLELQLTTGAIISLASDPHVVMKVIKKYLLPVAVANVKADGTAPVFVNGRYVGNTPRRDDILAIVRRLRRGGQCAKDVSVSCNARGVVHVSTTAGRACRPVLIVQNGRLKITARQTPKSWIEYTKSGVVEYIDCEEMDGMLVAWKPEDVTPEHTHCEISPTLMNGICAATIPFSNHNPSARNCYQSGKFVLPPYPALHLLTCPPSPTHSYG